MATLIAKRREGFRAAQFGLPGSRKYPMPDRSHAANAKARAKQMLVRGRLSSEQYARITAKTNRLLGRKK